VTVLNAHDRYHRRVVQRTIRTYDLIAHEYCRKTRQQEFLDWETEYIERLLSLITAPEPLILDVGCGDGRHCRLIEELGGSAVGIDLSRRMIAEAKAYYPVGCYCVMDMCSLQFGHGCFDGIWSSGSIYHVPKHSIRGVVAEFTRVLKPGGVVAVSFKRGEGEGLDCEPRSYAGSPRFFAYYTEDKIVGIFSQAGFTKIDSRTYPEDIYGDGIQQIWFRR
jgi:SAM-dependent methyltransferase